MSVSRIVVDKLGVRLGDAQILDSVSFEVGSGEFLTVIGPNGAGKSTLLRCLDGILTPSSGRILMDGASLGEFSRRQLAQKLSYVPQPDTASLEFTVRSYVEMGRYPHLGAWAALTAGDVRAVTDAMELTEVTGLAERIMASLSGGERQRVSIAAALAQGGSVLLLDEPTSFLDYRHQVQILDMLDRLHRERGLTVVAVTHDLNSMVAFSDTVLALVNGRTAFFGAPSDVLSHENLGSIYGAGFRLVPGGYGGLPLVVPARNGS